MVDFKREALVSTEWLADNLGAPDLRVVDASYYLPGEGLDPRQEFEAQHIPGAVFFDIDAIKDPGSELPHMLPPPHIFSAKVRRLGLGDRSEERRVGKECVSTCSARWSPYPYNTQQQKCHESTKR